MSAPTTATDDTCAPSPTHAIGDDAAAAIATTLKALSDPLRLRMLSAIATDARGESCVCDLAELADVSQPTVSHHLKVLRDTGVLTSERRGTWVWYRIDPALRPAVTTLLDSFREALGARKLATMLQEGARLTPAEAVDLSPVGINGGTTTLSDRERDVAERVHRGLTNREIAGELVLSIRTVDTHVQRIFSKLGVTSRAQVAAWYESHVG